jgi:carboxyl-terminal processing protease
VKRIFALFAAASVAAASAWGQAAPSSLSQEDKAEILQSLERTLKEFAFVPGADFTRFPEMLGRRQEQINSAQTPDDLARTVNEAMGDFGFSHIVFFPPSFGEQRLTQQRPGIGVRVLLQDGGLRVTDVFPDSPADKAGLKPGDLIHTCDGNPIRSVLDLRGDIGQKSLLLFRRTSEEMRVEVERGQYSTVLPESLTKAGPGIAVLKVPTFDQGYSRERIDRLMEEAQAYPRLILDLRSNGGGRVTNLQHLLGHFLDRDEQAIGTFIGKADATAFEAKEGRPVAVADLALIAEKLPRKVRAFGRKNRYQGRLAVLMNGATGSASEMAASSLKAHLNALLIGERTAGAVLPSMMMPLRDGKGFWVQYPVTDYVSINGQRLEGSGVAPDVEMDSAAYSDRGDETILGAVEIMKTLDARGRLWSLR